MFVVACILQCRSKFVSGAAAGLESLTIPVVTQNTHKHEHSFVRIIHLPVLFRTFGEYSKQRFILLGQEGIKQRGVVLFEIVLLNCVFQTEQLTGNQQHLLHFIFPLK